MVNLIMKQPISNLTFFQKKLSRNQILSGLLPNFYISSKAHEQLKKVLPTKKGYLQQKKYLKIQKSTRSRI